MAYMKIAFCAAEASPFAKVGGLADVVGSLPKALARLNEEVLVFIPHYGCIDILEYPLFETGITFSIEHRDRDYPIQVMESVLPGSDVKIYFISNNELYIKPEDVYPQGDPVFEATRYEVLGKATLHFLKRLNWQPDIFHIHDWHTSTIALYLKQELQLDPFYNQAGTVLTIHNMAYQGIVDGLNWLQEGLINSDALVAVSPTYAKEIMTDNGGAGLEGVMQAQKHKLQGILNGIDMDIFNPAVDPFIIRQYDATTVETGKQECKAHLQVEMGLEQDLTIPLLGMVTRVVEQKGMDLLLKLLPELTKLPAQFVILGAGQEEYVTALNEMNTQSANIRFRVGYNLALGQHIYSGSDMFLMPSRFEPCGLGQMIALRYGAVPVVRKTGGLADTVFDVDAEPGRGNGIVFEPYTENALLNTLHRAIALWDERSPVWQAMVNRGMTQDMSWEKSAAAYQQVYQSVRQKALQRI